ncbi:MFS transporter [Streptomyces sp. HNM0575]|uniref:MFS transporter n=1 Tax=Streptomyces sp. HNM0575 TaxID=2716338 RepID=UPI00145D80E7|nr:MFS transporter [Streptomyces sp. HNM0575]NLU74366.1 MFS transporter [Streptomyces sp. HNM0575]
MTDIPCTDPAARRPGRPATGVAAGEAAGLPWPGLLALFTAAFTAVLTELLPAGLLPQISGSFEVSQARAGFLVTGYATASFVAAIPLTAALRSLPRRPVLIGALIGFAVSNAVVAVSPAYESAFAARLLAGAAGGVLWAMLAGYAARMVPFRLRGRAIAVVLAGITVALSLGVPAGTALFSVLGWRTGFAALAVSAVLLVAWVRWKVPGFSGEPAGERLPLRGVVSLRGTTAILCVTLLLLTGHQAMYTYIAPFTGSAGFHRTALVLFVFGAATVVGIGVAGALADRRLRLSALCCLAGTAVSMLALGLHGGGTVALLTAVALWGVAFGGAPTLIQTALIDVSGTENADAATSMQATVYNAGIAAGSLTGGVVLDGWGPQGLPWTALPLVAAALLVVALARRHAFPALRRPR